MILISWVGSRHATAIRGGGATERSSLGEMAALHGQTLKLMLKL
jgi:hypothetical protein